MKKIEIVKGDNTFIFSMPLANDLIEYRINLGELQEQLIDVHEKAKPLIDLDESKRGDAENIEIQRLVVKMNLLTNKRDQLNYKFAAKHLIEITNADFSLDDIKELKVSINSLKSILDAFREALNKQDELGK